MHRIVILGLTALIATSPAQSKAMKWMDGTAVGLPAGAKLAVVKGDPTKTGEFVVRAKFRPTTPFRRITIRPMKWSG